MDYEKAYKEALERAKAGKPLDEVFSELKESEDERIRKSLVEYFRKFTPEKMWDEMFSFGDVVSYLEKQKEQNSGDKDRYMEGYMNGMNDALKEQKPAEWSEEDEKMLTGIIERGSSQIPSQEPALREEQMEWLMKRLRLLRPQQHWKPSEEQMKALEHCVTGWQDTADGALESLYNELSKL